MERIFDKVKVTKSYIGKSEMTSGNAYRVTMAYNGKRVWFVFNDNYLNESDKKDFIECLISDAFSYEYCKSLNEFIAEYEDAKLIEMHRVWPHKVKGEGHFVAKIQKLEDEDCNVKSIKIKNRF